MTPHPAAPARPNALGGNGVATGNGHATPAAPVASIALATPVAVARPAAAPDEVPTIGAALRLLARALAHRVVPAARSGAAFAPAALAIGLWLAALPHVDLRDMNDLGVVSVLPWPAYSALVVVTGGFCHALWRRPLRTTVLAAYVVVLTVLLYGLLTPLEEVPRLSVTWRHAGIADHIAGTGEVDPRIDAYFNWPGFFALLATVTRLTGLDAMQLASWAPVVSNLLFLLPVVAIARALTRDSRAVWLTAWVFLLANWVGQDYLSPQAFAFFLYLVVVAVLLTWFRPPARQPDRDAPAAGRARPPVRVARLTVVLLLLAAIVPSHQLTPFAAIAGTAALVLVRRCTVRGLPVVVAAMVGTWISFMTVAYMKSHVGRLIDGFGELGANAGANVGARLAGSTEHLVVVRVRLLLTAALWAIALLGALERWRWRRRDVAWLALGAAPFPLVALQSYGGEMLLRVYLLSLPFAALFVALLVFPARVVPASATRVLAVGALSIVLAAAFLVSRYGNERENQFTVDERYAVDVVYDLAPPGALVLAGVDNLPWKSEHYAVHEHETVVRLEERLGHHRPHAAEALALLRSRPPGCAFLVVTRSQHAKVSLEGIWPGAALPTLVGELRQAAGVTAVHASEDAVVLRVGRQPPPTTCAGSST